MKIKQNSRGEIVTNVLGSDGNHIVLNQFESYNALRLQQQFDKETAGHPQLTNALGYEVNITTLYAISKSVVEQKFATLMPADYMPVVVGENAWSDNILTYRDYSLGGDFAFLPEVGSQIQRRYRLAQASQLDREADLALFQGRHHLAEYLAWRAVELRAAGAAR